MARRKLTPEERIEALRTIVREHQCARVEGVMVDAFSASALVKLYDALNERNRAILASMTVRRMILTAYAAIEVQARRG